ncbi:HYR domain-containing protein [Flavobacterium sp.]|uniref:HYR domain-containing protein n=1 Tax=Flavobacterium sp. TaxID=239 RepID=UPI002C607710|nr:HYR domain-containing protein [Flavobacterium sp.]HSD06407.1 HYR domain-containing protein [Flavobacterium sp.]
MGKNYFFFKILILLGLFFGLTSANAQNLKIEQTQTTSGWTRNVVSGETVSFPAAGKSASSFTFTIKNTGVTTISLTGTPIVQISGTNASEFTCTQPSVTSLSSGASTTFTVNYLPTGLGLRTAVLQIPSSDPATPFVVNLKGASFDLYGAKSSVPSGSSTVVATDGSNGKFGRVGGGNIYVSAVTFGTETNLYWGPNLSTDGDLGLKVSMDDDGVYQGNETLTFDATKSNLPAGKVVWQGSTRIQNAITSSFANVLVRATMTATWFDGASTYTPISLIDPVSLGLSSQIGGLVKFDDLSDYLRANILIEASIDGGATWTPYLNFYDAYPTPVGPLPGAGIGKAYSSFSSAYYWDNIDPQLTKNATLTLNEGGTATISTTNLNANDLEDLTLAYGTKSNIVFKIVTTNNGLATNLGTGDLKLNGASLSKNDIFTLQDVEDGKVTFTHNGSETTYDEILLSFYDSKKELGEDSGFTVYKFTIGVTPVNDPPVANNLNFTSSYVVPLLETLTASDSDSATLTYSIVTNPTNGTISNFNPATGTFKYTPTLGGAGTDSFTYQVSDGSLVSSVKTVSITLINLPPTSQNEAYATTEDTVLTGTLTGTDPEGGTTSFQIDKQPNHGTIVLNPAGSFTYTPNLSRFGYDSFLFSVKDPQNNASTSYKATINITPRIDPGDVLVMDETLIRLYDPVTVQDTIITKNQGLKEGINLAYKKNVGLFGYDKFNGLIKIDPVTGLQTQISPASNFDTSGPIGGPAGMLIDQNNKIIMANTSKILEVDPVSGAVNTLFSGGNIGYATGVAYLSNGDLLISDASKILGGTKTSNLIRVAPDGTQTIVSSGNLMTLPLDIAILDNNTVVISDAGAFVTATDNIYKVDLTTGIQTLLSTAGNINVPSGLDVWKNKVYAINKGSRKLVEIDKSTGFQTVITGGAVSNPWGLFVVPNGIIIENLSSNDVSCINEQDGKINFTISGGTAPYFYSLDGNNEVQISSLPVTISNLKAKSYSLTVRDSMNENANTNAVVTTLADTQNPSISAPSAVNVVADTGSCIATNVTLGNAIASDNCTGYTVSNNAPTSFPIGATIVQWKVTDSSGNTATANQTVTVTDTQKPTITAPSAVNVVADAGSCVATNVTLGTPIASDNCTGYVVSNNAPTSFPIGATIVQWKVTDASGNITTANQTVTVTDTQNPIITAPSAVNTVADSGSCVATNVTLGTPIASDNCTGYIVSNNAPTSFPIGTTTVQWKVTDASGNTATANQTIKVIDAQNPVIIAPANVNTIAGTGSCVATNVTLGTPIASDNCTGYVVSNNAPTSFPIGATIVQWKVTDASGNIATANQTVTVADTQKPTITAPSAVNVVADAGSCVATNVTLGTPIASDNCSGYVVSNNAPTSFPIGITIVQWKVTDASGNIATANQTVTVTDTQNPAITAPSSVTTTTDAGKCTASGVNLGQPIVSDNCTSYTVTNNAPIVYPQGQTIVIWTAIDASGNKATASQTVTVTGLAAPNIQTSQNLCEGSIVSDINTNGFVVKWYSTSGGTIAMPNTIALTSGTYYAASYNGTCESPKRTAVTISVNSTLPPTGQINQAFCEGATLNDLVVSGSNITWYSSKTGTNPLPLSTVLKNQTKYYASQKNNTSGCESIQRFEVLVTVNKVAAPQGVSEYTFCSEVNPTLASISKNYSNVEWYDSVSQNNLLTEDYKLINEDQLYGYAYDAKTGCRSIDYLGISVHVLDCKLEIFNYITPNNNNQNEALVITNIDAFPKNKLQVFNRQGQMVYEVSAYGQNNSYFRGTSNVNGSGKKLPTGTYFYVLEYLSPITGKNENKKGFLYINNND